MESSPSNGLANMDLYSNNQKMLSANTCAVCLYNLYLCKWLQAS
jgi:hypothetical protein